MTSSAADTAKAAGFYASERGQIAAGILRARLHDFWPDLAGQAVLGFGYPHPYLDLWRKQAYRCIAAVPPQHQAGAQPSACAVEDDRLPFPDVSFDRILLIHSVDDAGDARRLLREVWRVLKDDGRMLVVAPNRLGLWAHVESTPFGQGQPYSPGQINQLLEAAMFRPERRDTALFVPPTTIGPILRSYPIWEQAGHALFPNLAGVTITEAIKDAYAAMPVTAPARRRVILPEAA
jgi:SAM-dependent methyltransferase